MALMALAQRCLPKDSKRGYLVRHPRHLRRVAVFGDGVITPAISVLSAVEGLEVVAPQLHDWIVPITLLVLVALFATQRFGTAKVAGSSARSRCCGSLALASAGRDEHPARARGAARDQPVVGDAVLRRTHLGRHLHPRRGGAGGDRRRGDLHRHGHFGAKPIRYAWYFFVLPSLMLNYPGQGALVLEDPAAIRNPFVGVPEWGAGRCWCWRRWPR